MLDQHFVSIVRNKTLSNHEAKWQCCVHFPHVICFTDVSLPPNKENLVFPSTQFLVGLYVESRKHCIFRAIDILGVTSAVDAGSWCRRVSSPVCGMRLLQGWRL